MADLFEDLELRGLVHQVSDPDLAQVQVAENAAAVAKQLAT